MEKAKIIKNGNVNLENISVDGKKSLPEYLLDDYELIPMDKITEEALTLALIWSANMKDSFLTHKLASDIMNYARRFHENEMKKLKK